MSEKVERVDTSFIGRLFPTFGRLFRGNSSLRPTPGNQGPKGGDIQAHLPIVNLLPPRLAFEKARRASRRTFGIVATGMLVSSALLWVGQAATIAIAQGELNAAQERVETANIQLGKLKEESKFFDALDYRINLERTMLASQVDQQKLLSLLSASTSGATITKASIKMLDATSIQKGADKQAKENPASRCGPIENPFDAAEVPIACLSAEGRASSRNAINAITQKLQASSLVDNVAVVQTGAPAADGSISFSITASINPAAGVKISTTAKAGA